MTQKMNPEIKQLWLGALRSGEYKQGARCLRSRRGCALCCLGVLCDIHAKQTGGEWYADRSGNRAYDGEVSLLPSSVVEWAGLADEDPFVIPPTVPGRRLSSLNDNGMSFPEIADAIEASL